MNPSSQPIADFCRSFVLGVDAVVEVKRVKAKKRVKRKLDHGGGMFV